MPSTDQHDLLPPPSSHPRSDQYFTGNPPYSPVAAYRKHPNNSSKIPVYILFAFVLLSVSFLIIGLVFLRVKTPNLQLTSISVEDLRRDPTSLHATLAAEVTLRNRVRWPFKVRGGNATLGYGNTTLGAGSFPGGGRAGKRGELGLSVSMELAGIDTNNGNFSRDIGVGSVRLWSLSEISGEFTVIGIIPRRRVSVMNCTLDLNLTSQAIQDYSCY